MHRITMNIVMTHRRARRQPILLLRQVEFRVTCQNTTLGRPNLRLPSIHLIPLTPLSFYESGGIARAEVA